MDGWTIRFCKDWGSCLQDHNWSPFDIISHAAPGENLQEEKLLNNGTETETAFSHSC